MFLIVLLLAIIVFSSVLDYVFLGCGYGCPLMFLVMHLLAIAVIVFLCFWLCFSWALLWLSSCIPNCMPPSYCHGHGHPFVFLVASSWPSL